MRNKLSGRSCILHYFKNRCSFQENFRYPEATEQLSSRGVTMKCAETSRDFEPGPVTIVRREFKLVR